MPSPGEEGGGGAPGGDTLPLDCVRNYKRCSFSVLCVKYIIYPIKRIVLDL